MDKNEELITNISYVNKDFQTIYEELLDTVANLTNKWSPSTSNESDPGVVLIKENAITADKNNYNIDKNILEAFPISVTQPANAMQLFSDLGYAMKWYQSATCTVSFRYTGGLTFSDTKTYSITIPKFSLITNEDEDITYTTIKDVTITEKNKLFSNTDSGTPYNAVEGVVQDFVINGSNVITLNNLDSDYRLYFNDKAIAENGIFIGRLDLDGKPDWSLIGTDDPEEWRRVDNLESYPLKSRVYSFGIVPNSNTCYIQFPQDIANLINNGICIRYITSRGTNGNISLYTLTKFASQPDIKLLTNETGEDTDINTILEKLQMSNVTAAINGADPESIESAYNGYKRVRGTFNTLVTKRDYENSIYNLTDIYGKNIISNIAVSDRTDDINYSDNVVTVSQDGKTEKVLKIEGSPAKMNAFNIGLYALNPANTVDSYKGYNLSYAPFTDQSVIENAIEEIKSIQHDYIDNLTNDLTTNIPTNNTETGNFKTGLLYLFKNFCNITGTVRTYNKVDKEEQKKIKENIVLALYKKFNPHTINFGEELDFEVITETIKNADTRIRSVSLEEPKYELRALLQGDYLSTDGTLDTSKEIKISVDPSELSGCVDGIKLLARLVNNGCVQLYNFDTNFPYDFGQMDGKQYPPQDSTDTIKYLSTNLIVDDAILGSGYTIRKNENIILYKPSLVDKIEYSNFLYFKWEGSNDIQKDETHVLLEGEKLTIYNSDFMSTPPTPVAVIGKDEIIRPNFLMKKYVEGTTTLNDRFLTTGRTITKCEVNSYTFDETTVPCMWVTNRISKTDGKDYYVLFEAGNGTSDTDQEIMLGTNEFFIYTNADRNQLVILASGTTIKRHGEVGQIANSVMCPVAKVASAEEINNSKVFSALDEKYEWYNYNTTALGTLSTIENELITLGSGTTITGTVSNDADSQTPRPITNISYTSGGTTTVVPAVSSSIGWSILTKLNLDISPNKYQEIEDSNQIVMVHYDFADDPYSQGTNITNFASYPGYLYASNYVYVSGGPYINVSVLGMSDSEIETLKLYTFLKDNSDATIYDTKYNRSLEYNGCMKVTKDISTPDNPGTPTKWTAQYNFSFIENNTYLFNVFNNNNTTITVSVVKIEPGTPPTVTTIVTQQIIAGENALITAPIPVGIQGVNAVTIETTSWATDGYVLVGALRVFDTNTPYSEQITNVLGDSDTSQSDSKYNYFNSCIDSDYDRTYIVPQDDLIKSDTPILDATSFFDENNMFNKYTIAQLGDLSKIDIADSSKR